MKQIHECTDGRGCRWRYTEDGCKHPHIIPALGIVYGKIDGLLKGCECGYEEKPKESTLKERIKDRLLCRIVYVEDGALEARTNETSKKYNQINKALVRDIVDYAWHKGCTSKANDYYDGGSTRESCYKELEIEK